jgi:hypothetical protein
MASEFGPEMSQIDNCFRSARLANLFTVLHIHTKDEAGADQLATVRVYVIERHFESEW